MILKFQYQILKRDAKKKSHTSLELSIIKGYLFSDRLTEHSPLLEQGIQQPKEKGSTNFTSAFILYKATSKWAGNLKPTE